MRQGSKAQRGGAFAYAAYNALLGIAGVAGLPAAPWLVRGAGGEWAERLGRLPADVAALSGRAPIWVHAASVGEVLAAEPLVRLLSRRDADHPTFMTTTSLTGRTTAREQIGVPAALLPLDWAWVVRRVLGTMHPAALVVVETELWPNLFRAARRAGVPLVLVSGKISARAAQRYAWVRPLIRAALRQVCAIAAQTADDAGRFVALGAPPERVRVVGSLKFSRVILPPAGAPPVALGERPVLVAASTHPGEEELVLAACRALWERHPSTLLVLAPRRPERFAEVGDLLRAAGVSWLPRTQVEGAMPAGVRVLLVDTLGELSAFFHGARGAFVGGTVAPVGGHNVLEPAAFGVPVAFGPRVENVREAASVLLQAAGAVQVDTADDLAGAWLRLLDDSTEGLAMGARARAEVERRAAAASECAAIVRACIERRA
jgi:3-deoxy-D-manno-octulosonic-acid transferase